MLKISKINWKGIAFTFFIFTLSLIVSQQDFIKKIATDEGLMTLVGFMLSILTTALIAIITICSDTSHLDIGAKDWKILWEKSKKNLSLVILLFLIFYIYLITICLLIAVVIIVGVDAVNYFWVIDTFAFMTTMSIILAFIVPIKVITVHRENLSGKVRALKNGDG